MSRLTPKPLKMDVLISGSGRTLKNFIDLKGEDKLPIDLRLVISSSAEAGGLTHAKTADIPTRVILRS